MQINIKKTTVGAVGRALAIALPVALLSACHDSYPILTDDDADRLVGNDEFYDRTPLMVFVSEQDYFAISTTRGTGEFSEDDNNKYLNTVFHVFAFRDGQDVSGQLSVPVDLRNYAYASNATAGQHDQYHGDCLVDGPDYLLGMPMKLNADHGGGLYNIADTTLYYSHVFQTVGYNFFGYHIDDFEPTPSNTHRTANEIYYDLVIDGAQDIIAGKAPKLTADVLDAKIEGTTSKLTFTTTERNTILNIGNYSTYAAHRGVHPVIQLEHCLTQLRFTAKAGDASASNIRITGINVEAMTSGKMTVASTNADDVGRVQFFESSRYPLPLREASVDGQPCQPLRTDGYVVNYPENSQDPINIGGCLMLPPDTIYRLTLYYTQTLVHNEETGETADHNLYTVYTLRPRTSQYYLDDETGTYMFRPGYIYNVNITVFGMRDIEVEANVSGWIEADEDIVIDPDNPGGVSGEIFGE